MKEMIPLECPYCQSHNVEKSTKGKITRGLSYIGSIGLGAIFQGVTGIPGVIGANAGLKNGYHEYRCKSCGKNFEVELNQYGQPTDIKKI